MNFAVGKIGSNAQGWVANNIEVGLASQAQRLGNAAPAGILKIDRQARVIIDAFSLCNREAQTELSLPELRR